MDQAVQLAIIALVMTVVQWALARWSKQEDYARQDKVAERVAKAAERLEETTVESSKRTDEVAKLVKVAANTAEGAAELLSKSNADAITRTDQVAKLAAEASSRIENQLTAIHTLVNSDMTAARTNERDAIIKTVEAQKNSISINKKHGIKPSTEDMEIIAKNEARVVELTQILADRLSAQEKVDTEKGNK
jgi:uncharacterized membrane-anchored protein YhcB (DUF1043 family)